MKPLAERAGLHTVARAAAVQAVLARLQREAIHSVRIAWCDLHGVLRGKTLMPHAVQGALSDGLGMVSTLMLKDTSDRTAFKVFEPGALVALPGFGMANNLLLLPDPASFRTLPWAPGTAWMQAQPYFEDGAPVALDARLALQRAVAALADAGYTMKVGLEVEFHIYRIDDDRADPQQADWPGEPPRVSLLHPGYNLLAEGWADLAEPALQVVRDTALGLGLPLRSLEIELGPSQVEAVFDATDALAAADHMVLFRNGVKQALRRAGYHASFMCLPPFANVMASGWHLHQSLRRLSDGAAVFMPDEAAATQATEQATTGATRWLSATGQHWLAGLLAHAAGGTVLATTTANAFGRFKPNAMAPLAASWARDNRGAALRVLGGWGDAATRIENRLGEPMANPYLYMASQVWSGLDGLRRALLPPPATTSPYASGQASLPPDLAAAVDALNADSVLCEGLGSALVACLSQVKRSEAARFAATTDKDMWQRREYFSRF